MHLTDVAAVDSFPSFLALPSPLPLHLQGLRGPSQEAQPLNLSLYWGSGPGVVTGHWGMQGAMHRTSATSFKPNILNFSPKISKYWDH